MKKITTDEFIKRANKTHNNFYDYSNVVYLGSKVKVEIICPKHGVFKQEPRNHIFGQQCDRCGSKAVFTIEKFIDKANETHNNVYDYSIVKYRNMNTKVEIICPKHGAFKQTPDNHLTGTHCPKCSHKTINLQEFIEKANETHNNFYDYSETLYVDTRTKIKIVCPKHGIFHQRSNSHLSGNGCPACKQTKGEKLIRSYLKLNKLEFKQEFIYENFRFDFVIIGDLPKIIEYNGIQHYTPQSFGSKKINAGFNKLIDNVKRDYLKFKKCKENNVPLLVIPYWDIKRIPEILDDFFKGVEPIFSIPPKEVIEFQSNMNTYIHDKSFF